MHHRRRLPVTLAALLLTLAGAAAGCATRGPATMRVAVVGHGADGTWQTVDEIEERLVGALSRAPRVEPFGGKELSGERGPMVQSLVYAGSDDAARALAAEHELTHLLLVDVGNDELGASAELRGLDVTSGEVVWRDTWAARQGGLGAKIEPAVRRFLTATGFHQGLPPVTGGPARREVADLVWEGNRALGDGDEIGAAQAFAEAVRRDPGAVRAHLGLARLLSGQGDYQGALAAAERALAVRPDLETLREAVAMAADDVGQDHADQLTTIRDELEGLEDKDDRDERKAETKRRELKERRDATRGDAIASFERAFALAERTRPLLAARAALRLARVVDDREAAIAALTRALARLERSPCALGVGGAVIPCVQSELLPALRVNRDLVVALNRLTTPNADPARASGGPEAPPNHGPTAPDREPRDCAGATPLLSAAAGGELARVDEALAGGAAVDARDLHGWTALHRAARSGSVAVLRRLLEAGASPSARDARGRTALQVAVLFERLDATRFLAGVSPLEARTMASETALHLAARVGSAPLVRALVDAGAAVDAPAWAGRTPLTLAAAAGHAPVVRALIAAGADPATTETTGLSTLHVVASEGTPEGIRALVEAGAEVDALTTNGQTPLDLAVTNGRADIVRELLSLGADPNRRDRAQRTALHHAAADGQRDVVVALLDGGADPNAKDESARTPLATAALAGSAEVVRALVVGGADPRAVDGNGQTPLQLAIVAERAAVVKVLFPEAPAGNPSEESVEECELLLLGARAGTSNEVAAALIAGGCPIDGRDDRGRTPAMVAAERRHERLALYLLERGADVDARDPRGATLLHYAAQADAVALSRQLIDQRPGLADVRDDRGWLPLHAAAAGGSLDVIHLLVTTAGTAPLARTDRGVDAAHVAAAFGHTWLVAELVREHGLRVDLELAAALGDVDRVRTLLGGDPARASQHGVTGLTPLMIAIVNRQAEVTALLLGLKVDVRAVVAEGAVDPALVGLSATFFASRSGQAELVRIMVAEGATPPPSAEIELDDMSYDAHGVRNNPRFKQLFDLSNTGLAGGAGGLTGEPVVPVGAEPLGVQIRERTLQLDVLLREASLPQEDGEHEDDGWDLVAARCVSLGEHAVAARELEDQVVLRRTGGRASRAAMGLVHHNLGRARTYLARYDEAEAALELAGDELAEVPVLLAAVHVARADLFGLTGRYGEAERLYQSALKVWTQPKTYTPVLWLRQVRSALANLYTDMARYADARDAFAELVAARSAGDPDALAVALNNQAVLFDLLGDHASATAGYDRALKLLTPRASVPTRAILLNNLGFAQLRGGDAQATVRLASEAIDLLDAPPWKDRPHYARGRALVTWARAAVALGDLARARRLLARADKELRAVHGDLHGVVADVVRRRGEIALLEGRPDGALERFYEALAIAKLSASPEHVWRVEDDLARALAASGRPRAAIAMGKLAVNTLQALREKTAGVGAALARAYLTERTAPYRRLAGLLVDQGRVMEAQLVLDMLKDEEAYAFTRASRAAGGIPVVRAEESAASAISGGRAADLQGRESLKKYLRGFKRAVAAALLAVDEDDLQAAATIEARLDQLSLDRLDDLRAFLEDPTVVSEHVAFLQIFLSDDKVRILLTRPEQETRPFESKVPVRRVYQLISRLREQLQDERSDPRATARELYDALLRPVRSELDGAGVKTLMVWLDGALRYAPLAALHDGEGWLVERFRVAMYTPVTHAALKDRRSGAWRVNAFGMSQEAPGFDPLPGVPDELDAIVARADEPDGAGAMRGALWLDGDFTAETLTTALRDTGVQAVHVASHYAFDPEGDEGSFLLLGDKSHMSLGAIRRIARQGRLGLMTFSACNTAVGLGALAGAVSSNDPLGLEVEGLGNVVQRELATAVLATLWPVVDSSTVAFMRELYGALEADPSLSKAAAVQRAQLRLLRGEVTDGKPNSWSHPRFWAPFVLMGNWR